MKKDKVSVVTCVYNGVKTIDRVFNSVKQQSYKNIEHIIIDDGSTDTGLDEKVEKYKREVNYPIIYIKKENGGKHTALNVAWDNCSGFFVVTLDADDEILPDSIEYLVDEYYNIPQEIRNEFWCVQGRCIDNIENKMIGNLYPENINIMSLKKQNKVRKKISGEKFGLKIKNKLDNMRFPTPKFVSFVNELYLWKQLNYRYRTWFTNKICRIYYINQGETLSKPKKSKQYFSNTAFYSKFELENFKIVGSVKEYIIRVIKYIISYELSSVEYKNNYKYLLNKNYFLVNILLIILKIPIKLCCIIYKKHK